MPKEKPKMVKDNKKTMLFTIGLAALALALMVAFIVTELRESGKIGSVDSSKIMKEFYKNFNSDKRTVIYYASSECSYCSLETPILETIAEDYDMDYHYIDATKLSTKQRNEILKKLGIEHATPTTVVVKDGKVIDKNVGYADGKEYVKFFIKTKMIPSDAEYSSEKYITFIDYGQYQKLIANNEVKVVVIGQTTCGHCIAIKPALNSIAEDYDLVINYLNLTEMTENESDSFFKSLKEIGYDDPDFLADGSFGTPLTLIIEDGKVTNYIAGERTISQLVREFEKFGLIK